jgi:hypothetical protein
MYSVMLDVDESHRDRITGADYRGSPVCTGERGTVYRALLLRVQPDTDPDNVARLEGELSSMPRYVHGHVMTTGRDAVVHAFDGQCLRNEQDMQHHGVARGVRIVD